MQIPKRYASNRFVDRKGEIYGLSIVTLTPNRTMQSHSLFSGKEEPFTQWIGGTVIASPLSSLPTPVVPPTTLQDWIELLVKADNDASLPLYLWHTIITDMNAHCPPPIRL